MKFEHLGWVLGAVGVIVVLYYLSSTASASASVALAQMQSGVVKTGITTIGSVTDTVVNALTQ